MALRCVLFSSDPGAVEPICQALADLGVEGEHCTEAVAAVEKVCRESFQIVIVDWDKQPEAGTLLAAARERKLSERPLMLAVVSEDAGVPKALQAGANSILRKPVLAKQVADSLTRARDLLRARESAAQAAAAGVGTVPVSAPANLPSNDATLRAGEFLQSSASASQIDTESEMQKSLDRSAGLDVNALKDLEPTASAVAPDAAPPSRSDEPRGLQWYLNQRAAAAAPAATPSPAPAPSPSRPELLGYDQIHTQPEPAKADEAPQLPAAEPKEDDKKAAAELFAYIAGEDEESSKSARPGMRLGKGAIIFASVLAACAIVAAPQAPWNPQVRKLWGRGRQVTHAWLNPQLVTPVQAPASHENFGRAGDEYKLPVAENIPDATTDPAQIRVTPMVDPTAKKPNAGATADPNLAPPDAGTVNPGDPAQTPATATPAQGNAAPNSPESPASNGAASNIPGPASTAPDNPVPATQPPPATQPVQNAGSGLTASATNAPATTPDSIPPTPAVQPAPVKNPPPRPVAASSGPPIPSSLKSQMASMTPDASGNKAPETALPSIEPVAVPEATERALITDQPAPVYPANINGQQGTVVLQVLVGRDGTVQDAKFLQGSLAFARAAIDGAKQWKFKPYIMNGRPVSVQTNLTIGFRPGQ
jgi:periplasmic protein TonB